MASFATPIAILGLTLLAPLVALYILHLRGKPRDVSSTFLWEGLVRPSSSGRRRDRLRTPLTLVLETLAILLLILAAARPFVPLAPHNHELVLILDDSYSMRAQDPAGRSALDRARHAAIKHLDRQRAARATLILAGPQPAILASAPANDPQLRDSLDAWNAEQPDAAIDAAIALATQTAATNARFLVITDAPPSHANQTNTTATDDDAPNTIATDRTRYLAVGAPADNIAIVSAVRGTAAARHDHLIAEIANLGANPATTTLSLLIEPPTTTDRNDHQLRRPLQPLDRLTITLQPNETRRFRTRLDDADQCAVFLSLDANDALAIDDDAILLPDRDEPVRVALDIDDPLLDERLRRAILASRRARILQHPHNAELLFTDRDRSPTSPTTALTAAVVRFTNSLNNAQPDPAPTAFTGPFIIDRNHPIAEGLDLTGVIWAAPLSPAPPTLPQGDTPVVMLDSTPLVTERFTTNG